MAPDSTGLFAQLKRRNVLRAAALYAGAAWALAQGISQLSPALGLPDWATRWFVIACTIGFPFWIAFAWLYRFTPHGLQRETDTQVATDASFRHSHARRLDFAIIGVMAIAIVLLASGYFIRRDAPVTATGDVAETTVSPKHDTAPVSAKSIAVLPFENLSNDKDNEYFVAGMQDLILTKLSGIGDLKVISRTSTARYAVHPDDLKTIGEQLGVTTLLEGSVQKQGNQVMVNVQLIDARSNAHLWAQSYTRTLENVFGVEGEVATQIATALQARLSPAQTTQLAAPPTTNPAAYDAFLRAEYLLNEVDVSGSFAQFKPALALYRRAVEKDQDFALAWARLSYAEGWLAFSGAEGVDIAELNRQALADAQQALKLQPDLPAAQLALGYCYYYGRADYAAAQKTFAAALAQRPNDADALAAQGYVERRMGRFGDAVASLGRAAILDPRNFSLAYDLGLTYDYMGRYAEGETWLQRALALEPDSFAAKLEYSQAILFRSGDAAQALAALGGDDPRLRFQRSNFLAVQRKFPEAIALVQSIPDTPDDFSPGYSKEGWLGTLCWQAGDKARARSYFAQALPKDRAALDTVQGFALAGIWTNVGRDEIGVGNLEQGLAAIAKSQAILTRTPDPFSSADIIVGNAFAYAMAGRADLAVPLLAGIAPPGSGVRLPYQLLRLYPGWDPIRQAPAFQALMQAAALDPADHAPMRPRTGSGSAFP